MRALLVLYFNDETKVQTWNVFFGGHKEANENQPLDGCREVHRVFIDTCFIETLESE